MDQHDNHTSESRRLVLASGFGNEGLPNLVSSLGWQFMYTRPPGSSVASEYAWQIDAEHTFHYFECTNYPIEYCVVVGPQHDEILIQVSTMIDFLDVGDVASAFDRATTIEEMEITTFALGLAAGRSLDIRILERIRLALANVQPRVRLAAIDAALITGWEDLRADLARLSSSDPDPIVQQAARIAVYHDA